MKHLLLFFILIWFSTATYALPKNMQAEQYMRGAKKAVQAHDYQKSLEYFEKIIALKVKMPTAFYYFYGTAKMETGRPIEAKNNFESYLTTGGHKAKYYLKTLDKIEKAEEQIKDFQILSNGYFKDYSYENEGLKVKNESLKIESCILTMQNSAQYLAETKEQFRFELNIKHLVFIEQECTSFDSATATCEVQLLTCGPNREVGCDQVTKSHKKGSLNWEEDSNKFDEVLLNLGEQAEASTALKNAIVEEAKKCEAELMEELMAE